MQDEIRVDVRQESEQERERLVSLINSMADGVIALDKDARILVCNGAALNVLDVNISVNGQPLSRIVKLLSKTQEPIDVQELIIRTETATTHQDMLLQYEDGSTINLYMSIAPVHLGFGKDGQRGFVILLRDITKEKSLEEERDEFISVVSHELRTPVTIAEGNVSNALMIVGKKEGLDDVQAALKQTYDQIIFLTSMINDLSTLSRAERGKLNVEVEDINAHELLDELLENYTPQAAAKNLQLHTEVDPNLELLKSSKLYVREVLQNFITNSIKYTETGSVTIAAHMQPGGILFEVRDTGIGISKSDQRKVFDKFFRSEDARTRKNNGTGLGLYVTMKLARLLQAEISLESELNKGSVFKIFIPNLHPAAAAVDQPA
jgi:two-component system phosphate regulon sensor histidine kinase PhoR